MYGITIIFACATIFPAHAGQGCLSQDEITIWHLVCLALKQERYRERTQRTIPLPHPATLNFKPSGHTRASLQAKALVSNSAEKMSIWERRQHASNASAETNDQNYLLDFLKNPRQQPQDVKLNETKTALTAIIIPQ